MPVFAEPGPAGPALPPQPDGVPWPTHEWPMAAPDPDVDAERLTALADEAFGSPDDGPWGMSLALVIVHRGRLILERYGPTAGPDVGLISWSMAKSITQALVGIAQRDGLVDVAAPAAVPEWRGGDDGRRHITLDQLLRMVPGTEFVEDYVDDQISHCIDMLFGAGNPDMAAYTAALPAIAAPDTVFNYSSGTTNLICRILADLVGPGDEFAAWMWAELLDPIGMASAEPTFDGAGTWVGSSFLNTTAREFAKFGYLYLRDGVWEDRRLLPEGWVDYARTPRAADDEGSVYGAHWWIWDPPAGVFACQGYETQRILVDPRLGRRGGAPREDACRRRAPCRPLAAGHPRLLALTRRPSIEQGVGPQVGRLEVGGVGAAVHDRPPTSTSAGSAGISSSGPDSLSPNRSWKRRSGAGAHQFHSPAIFISAGTNVARTMNASTRTAMAETEAEQLDERHARRGEGEERDRQQQGGGGHEA